MSDSRSDSRVEAVVIGLVGLTLAFTGLAGELFASSHEVDGMYAALFAAAFAFAALNPSWWRHHLSGRDRRDDWWL